MFSNHFTIPNSVLRGPGAQSDITSVNEISRYIAQYIWRINTLLSTIGTLLKLILYVHNHLLTTGVVRQNVAS